MKPFNLNAALTGEAVKLRDGSKAYVLGRVPETLSTDKALYVAVVRKLGGDEHIIDNLHLSITGNYFTHLGNAHHEKDIIGMWEEPIKYHHINGHKFPKPCSEPLKDGQSYFTIIIEDGAEVVHFRWEGDDYDNVRLERGIVHTTQEAAEAHADAINSLFRGEPCPD